METNTAPGTGTFTATEFVVVESETGFIMAGPMPHASALRSVDAHQTSTRKPHHIAPYGKRA